MLYSEHQFKKETWMNTFGLYSKIRAQAGQRDALIAVLLEGANVLQQDAACYLYIVNVSATEPDTVWVTEAWRSRADHETSLTREDITPILLRGRPLIASFERIELEPIGGKGLSTDGAL
jgi:quinol monooxygenase YgiN